MSEGIASSTPTPVAPLNSAPEIKGTSLPNGATPPGSAKPGDVATAAQEAIRKLKYKTHDGKDAEVDEQEAIKIYLDRKQHQAQASKALNEGKALRRQSEELLQMLKDEGQLKTVLKKLGYDDRKLAEKILSEHLEDELMDPKDKELRNLKAEIARREEIEKKQRDEIQKKLQAQRVEVLRQKYEQEFIKTLDEAKLPKTKQTVARMAGYIAQCARLGYQITPMEASKLVAEDLRREHKSIAGEADVDAVISLYGEDFLNKLRKYDSSRVKNPEAVLKTPLEQAKEHRVRGTQNKRMTTREWQLHKRGIK
jgi:hypothetical protein